MRYINAAMNCCDDVIGKYDIVNKTVDEYQNTFDKIKINLEDAEKDLVSSIVEIVEDIINIKNKIEELQKTLKELIEDAETGLIATGLGAISMIFSLFTGPFFPIACFLGGVATAGGVAELIAADEKIKELESEIDELMQEVDKLKADIIDALSMLNTVQQFIELHNSISDKVGDLIDTWKDLRSELDSLLADINEAGDDAFDNLLHGAARADVSRALDELKKIKADNDQVAVDSFEICVASISIGDTASDIDQIINKSDKMEITEYVMKFG